MAGFLDSLVARTAGQLPVLERRTRALFEPAQAGRGVGLAEVEAARDPATLAPAAHARDGAHVDPASAPRPVPGERIVRETTHRVTVMAAPTSPDRSAAGRDDATGLLEAPRAAPSSPAPAILAAVIARSDSKGLAPDTGGSAPRRAPTPALDPAPASRVPAPPRARSDDSPPTTASARAPRDEAPPVAVLVPRPAPPALPAIANARATGTPARGDTRTATPVAAPAPIQVNIGRVEIRAVGAPPERPRAAAPAAPRLSLDDYLRRRNGASR